MELIGILSGFLIVCAYCFYIVAILKGHTKPNRATWFMLTAISLVIALSYRDLGATDTLWAPIADLLGTLVIAILAIFYGTGGWDHFDKWCIAVAFFSIALYVAFPQYPLFILIVTLLMDGAAMAPTIKHAYVSAWEEDQLAWGITLIANILTVVAIGTWTLSVAIYPVYMLIINGLIFALIVEGRIRHSKMQNPAYKI